MAHSRLTLMESLNDNRDLKPGPGTPARGKLRRGQPGGKQINRHAGTVGKYPPCRDRTPVRARMFAAFAVVALVALIVPEFLNRLYPTLRSRTAIRDEGWIARFGSNNGREHSINAGMLPRIKH